MLIFFQEPSVSSLSSLDDKLQSSTAADEDIVRQVFYSTRENINIIHELFRQVRSWPVISSIFVVLFHYYFTAF